MIFSQLIPPFSRREQEILQLIFEGYTSQEIAERLFISLQTVESHRKNMISKTGTRNMFGVVRIALAKGILQVPLPAYREFQNYL